MNEVDLQTILDNLHEGVYFVDPHRMITYWSRGAEQLTGFAATDVIGRHCHDNLLCHINEAGEGLCHSACPLAQTIADGQARDVCAYLHHKDGQRVPVQIRVAPIRSEHGEILGAVESFSDNSALVQTQHLLTELQKLAMIDPLTGLPNRRYLELRLAQRLGEFHRYALPVAVLIADVDHFKQINDRFGHATGDQALRAVGQTLASSCRSVDVLGRWGGDEFVGLLTGTTTEDLRQIGERLRMTVSNCAVRSVPDPIPLSISLGIALAQPSDTPESLLQCADISLYQSKTAGRNCTTIYAPAQAPG